MIDFEPNNEQEMPVNSISRFAKGPMRKVFRVSEEEGRVPADIVQFQNCRVPLANKLGDNEGIDFDIILNYYRLAMSAAAVGVVRAA